MYVYLFIYSPVTTANHGITHSSSCLYHTCILIVLKIKLNYVPEQNAFVDKRVTVRTSNNVFYIASDYYPCLLYTSDAADE